MVIDLPQAVAFTTNADAHDLLQRDLANVATWFSRRGVAVELEELYVEMLVLAPDPLALRAECCVLSALAPNLPQRRDERLVARGEVWTRYAAQSDT